MSVIAVYNLKGGVGKTTTAVNLAYLSAAAGERTLLWDLDPQAASSFALRVRPHVAGFSRKTLDSGHALAAAIKETDFEGLDLLPADFGYRKLDRLLSRRDKPERLVGDLLATLGRGYDAVWLDCPPGFSLLTESVFAAADVVLVPTIPTVLSLRTLAQLLSCADRCDAAPHVAAFLSMVDGRKALHRHLVEWARRHPAVFLTGQVPYSSVVEQMAVLRMPLAAFAARQPASLAFAAIRAELQRRLCPTGRPGPPGPTSILQVQAIESLIAGLDIAEPAAAGPNEWVSRGADRGPACAVTFSAESPGGSDAQFVHSFDTDGRDLERRGYVLELHERSGHFLLVAARSARDAEDAAPDTTEAQVQIDRRWGTQILSGGRSPLAALERRAGEPLPRLIDQLRATVGERTLRRIDSRLAERPSGDTRPCRPESSRGKGGRIQMANPPRRADASL